MGKIKALILAAGLGTRLRPYTEHTPKCLLPIGDRPLLDYWLIALANAGIREILINTHSHAEKVRYHLQEVTQRGGLDIVESYEPSLLGSAATISATASWATDAEQIIIIYADNLSEVNLAQTLLSHYQRNSSFTMLLFRTPNPSNCGIVQLDDSRRIISFQEKPTNPTSDLANAGIYVVNNAIYQQIAEMRGMDIGHDILPRFIGVMNGLDVHGYHQDIGSPQTYLQAKKDIHWLWRRWGWDAQGNRPAIFLDRDGTLINSVHYLADPEDVKLVPGAAKAIHRMREAGYACVVVSNQSAIGRGIISEEQHRQINDKMCALLADEGAVLDALYHCPIVPKVEDRTIVEHFDRKPGPGMLLRAAQELRLDIGRSWIIGDMISDVLAGENAGCRKSLLIRMSNTPIPPFSEQQPVASYTTVSDVSEAAELIWQDAQKVTVIE